MTTTIEKILAKAAAFEAQAAALRLAASLLAGDATAQKQATARTTVSQAIALRRAQQNGHGAATNGHAEPPAAPAKGSSAWAQLQARRDAKAAVIVGIVRDYGKPMALPALQAAARAQGIPSLKGLVAYIHGGYLKKLGKGKGKGRYAFLRMPEPR